MLRRRITKLPNLVGRKAAREEPKIETEEPKSEPAEPKSEPADISQEKEHEAPKEIQQPPVTIPSTDTNRSEPVVTTEELDEKEPSIKEDSQPKPIVEVKVRSVTAEEYPVPPVSPSKFNRARIKAVPRLGQQRKTSFSVHGSASESEDDSKRTVYRIRNDSVCSVTSVTTDGQPAPEATCKRDTDCVPLQRKFKRNEQTRRLAEARREFKMKFGKDNFDKQKLTMLDLIFYNPSTNPMSKANKKKASAACEESVDDPDAEQEAPPPDGKNNGVVKKLEEETKPPPEAEEPPEDASDEENTIPAPQIKVGANGEIIVDEQSLVIENRGTKRDRAALQATKVVDGDLSGSYGIYKRVKRSKDWSHAETLRFYKALNTLGPDFTLMCELFPDRNRRELKLKFKKEERINLSLIDRAIRQPVPFNMDELKREVEMEKKEILDKAQRQEEKAKVKELKRIKTKRNPRKNTIKGIYIGEEEEEETTEAAEQQKRKKKKVVRTTSSSSSSYEYLRGGINSLLSEDEDEEEEEAVIVSEEDYFPRPRQPTRSGRVPKLRKSISEIYAANEKLRLHSLKRRPPAAAAAAESSATKAVPAAAAGSILISSSKSTEGGGLVFKLFMVTKPSKSDEETDEPLPPENNFTIPADEKSAEIIPIVAAASGPVILQNILIPSSSTERVVREEKLKVAEDEKIESS